MAINDNTKSATAGVPSPTPSSTNESGRGVWTEDEHNRFLEALQHYPNGPWRLVAEHVGTRSVRQVQTHAQKYHEKVARRLRGLRKDRRLVQRSEHRIDSDMLEICHEMTRDSVPLPPRVARSPHITGILQRPAARTDSASVHTTESKQEEDQDEDLASSAGPFVPWGGAVLAPYHNSANLVTPSFDDCLDYLIEALSPNDYDSEEDDSKRP